MLFGTQRRDTCPYPGARRFRRRGYAMLSIGTLDLFTGIATDAELIRHQLADRAYYSAAWSIASSGSC